MTLKPWHWVTMILVTAALVVMAPSDDTEVTKKGKGPAQSSNKATTLTSERDSSRATGRVELELLNQLKGQRQEKGKVSDVFNQTPEYVARPSPKFVAPPPPVDLPPPVVIPVAPPIEFVYLGRYGEADTKIVVLSKGDRVYTVKVGDVIENTYRIEKFTPGMVNFTYLPLNITQSLTTGDSL
jgi:hypothetical protein